MRSCRKGRRSIALCCDFKSLDCCGFALINALIVDLDFEGYYHHARGRNSQAPLPTVFWEKALDLERSKRMGTKQHQ
jgi:hypothetical protein